MGEHCDQENVLGLGRDVYSITLGAHRRVIIRKKTTGATKRAKLKENVITINELDYFVPGKFLFEIYCSQCTDRCM